MASLELEAKAIGFDLLLGFTDALVALARLLESETSLDDEARESIDGTLLTIEGALLSMRSDVFHAARADAEIRA